MTNQSLDGSEMLNVRWATDDPNPRAIEAERQDNYAQLATAMYTRGMLTDADLDMLELEGHPTAADRAAQAATLEHKPAAAPIGPAERPAAAASSSADQSMCWLVCVAVDCHVLAVGGGGALCDDGW